jgi:hypothetical protein
MYGSGNIEIFIYLPLSAGGDLAPLCEIAKLTSRCFEPAECDVNYENFHYCRYYKAIL